MAEISKKFYEVANRPGCNVEVAAKELGVSRASFYNYLAKTDLPRFDVLQRASEKWNIRFELLDAVIVPRRRRPGRTSEAQLTLPFVEALREQDVRVVKVTAKKPNAVELKVMIRFAG